MAAKLEKRQYIILGLMAVAVLYGAWELWPTGSRQAEAPNEAAYRAEVVRFKDDLTARAPRPTPEAEAHLTVAAETPWERDPFVAPATYQAWKAAREAPLEKEKPETVVSFEYTGFVGMGDHRLAIINGLDYETNDILLNQDYRVRQIEPHLVVLENVLDGALLEIPIQEVM